MTLIPEKWGPGYQFWAQQIHEYLLEHSSPESPIFLNIDFEEPGLFDFEAETDLFSSLCMAVRATLSPAALSGNVFERHITPARKFQRLLTLGDCDLNVVPPFLPLLLVLVKTAEDMHSDDDFSENNFYGRLCGHLGLEVARSEEVGKFYRQEVAEYWNLLNSWIRANKSLGRPTAIREFKGKGIIDWIGVPIAQAIVRSADREKISEIFFSDLVSRGEKVDLDEEEFADALDKWIESSASINLSQRFKKIHSKSPERVAQTLFQSFETWEPETLKDGSINLIRPLTASLQLIIREKIVGKSLLVQLRLAEIEPELCCSVSIGSSGNASPEVSKVKSEDDSFHFGGSILPVKCTQAELFSGFVNVKAANQEGSAVRKPRGVVPFVKRGPCLEEVNEMALGEKYQLLISRELIEKVPEVLIYLREIGCPQTEFKVEGLDAGWTLTEEFLMSSLGSNKEGLAKHFPVQIDAYPRIRIISGSKLPVGRGLPAYRLGEPLLFFVSQIDDIVIRQAVLESPSGTFETVSIDSDSGAGKISCTSEGEYTIRVEYLRGSKKKAIKRRFEISSLRLPHDISAFLEFPEKTIIKADGIPATNFDSALKDVQIGAISVGANLQILNLNNFEVAQIDNPNTEVHFTSSSSSPGEGSNESEFSEGVESSPSETTVNLPNCVLKPGAHHKLLEDAVGKREVQWICKLCGMSGVQTTRRTIKKHANLGLDPKKRDSPTVLRQNQRILLPEEFGVEATPLIDADSMLYVASAMGSGKTEDLLLSSSTNSFPMSIIWNLAVAGHIEFSRLSHDRIGERYSCLPPMFVPRQSGYRLIGARDENLIKTVLEALSGEGSQASLLQNLSWPSELIVDQITEESLMSTIDRVNDALGLSDSPTSITIGSPLNINWLNQLKPISTWLTSLKAEDITFDSFTASFSISDLKWEPFSNRTARAYAFRQGTHTKNYYFRPKSSGSEGTYFNVGYRLAKWLAAREERISPITFDASKNEITVPLGMDFPLLISRGIYTITGVAPQNRGGRIIYSEIDSELFETINRIIYH